MDLIPAALTDAEVDAICSGLRQGAAQVRYLQRLGVPVARKPNGRPLVRREVDICVAQAATNTGAMEAQSFDRPAKTIHNRRAPI